jgi:hypothetical protein
MLIAGAILAAALAAQGAEAAKPAAGQAEASAAAKPAERPPEAKKICVTEAQLGSHFKKRICATQEEWDRRRERDAAEMAKASDRTAACTGSAC